MLMATFIVSTAILLTLGILVMRSITDPLSQISIVTAALADGQRDVDVPAKDYKIEVGILARALLVFKDNPAETKHLRIEPEKAEK